MRTVSFLGAAGSAAASLLLAADALAAAALPVARSSVALAGPPVSLLSADLDADGLRDLAVVLAYSSWDQTATSELTTMDGVEGVVEVMTVVPELADRRELWILRGLVAGGFGPPEILVLGPEVRSLAVASDAGPLLALTDFGVSRLFAVPPPDASRGGQSREPDAGGPEPGAAHAADVGDGAAAPWSLAPVLAAPTLLSGAAELIADLPFVADLDADGEADLLLPTAAGLAIYPGPPTAADGDATLAREPAAVLAWPELAWPGPRRREVPLPRLVDLDGDRRPELVLRADGRRGEIIAVWHNRGGGRFAGPWRLDRALDELPAGEVAGEVAWLGDLDADGGGEVVLEEEIELDDDAGMRAEIANAKSPRFVYRVVPLRPAGEGAFALDRAGVRRFESRGYAFGGDADIPVSSGFQDLDGDGRLDLVSIDLDFSLFQGLKLMTVQRISLGLDFRVRCQGAEGGFREVVGLDLSGKFKLKLRDVSLGTMVQFAGDFDGDGRVDFVQAGRGRKVGIHRGLAGCRYAASPDFVLELARPAEDLALVRARDLDGDGRADLMVIQSRQRAPAETGEGASRPVELELYLSRGVAQ